MNRRFVQYNCVFPEVNAKLRIARKKSCRNFSCLPHKILVVFQKLLVLARIVADDNELYVIVLRYFVKCAVVYYGRFNRIRRRLVLSGGFLKRHKRLGECAPFFNLFSE